MDGGLINDLSSSTEIDSNTNNITSYTEKFNEFFPYYLSIGMTEKQYWDEDCQLVIAYRKAEEIRLDRRNREMWLQGKYVYDALCCVSPILHAFAKNGTKPIPYLTEPYIITEKQAESKSNEIAKKTFEKGNCYMESFARRYNMNFEGE